MITAFRQVKARTLTKYQRQDMASDHDLTDELQVPGEQMWFLPPDESEESVDYSNKPAKAMRMQQLKILQLQEPEPSYPPITQAGCYKSFYMNITEFGLNYAYHMETQPFWDNEKFKFTGTKKPKEVIVVGAGMAGLSAAYELAQVGHHVTIIEKQSRVGGRVKTLSEPHFFKGLWSDCKSIGFCLY